jgi:hypothetical protein
MLPAASTLLSLYVLGGLNMASRSGQSPALDGVHLQISGVQSRGLMLLATSKSFRPGEEGIVMLGM